MKKSLRREEKKVVKVIYFIQPYVLVALIVKVQDNSAIYVINKLSSKYTIL